jgi:hypothetical protein
MTEPTTYSARSAAIRAARASLQQPGKPVPLSGVHFEITESGDRFGWKAIDLGGAEIKAEHVPGEPDHFRLNEAGQKAVKEAREAEKAAKRARKAKPEEQGLNADISARDEAKPRMSAKHKEALALAEKGELPKEPDFSAETHKRWRPKLAEVVALAKAGDVDGLRAYAINPISTSPKAIDRFRSLAIVAIESRH